MTPEEKLESLGIKLDPVEYGNRPLVPWVRTGNLLFLSGRGSGPSGKKWNGQLGKEYDVKQGYEAAREVGISLISALKAATGDLTKVKRIVKLLSMVNCVSGFADTPAVAHGCSDLLFEVFGEAGRHARSAIGMAGLPGNIPVEIELIAEVE